MCIRGKGSHDTHSIDAEESNNILCRLNRDLFGDELKIRYLTQPYDGTNFLFDQVSEGATYGDNAEPYSYKNSVLNDNGKQITKRVLGLLLPSDYEIECQNGKILVNHSDRSLYQTIADSIDEHTKEVKNDLQLLESLDAWVKELFPNGFSDLPDNIFEFREKLKKDTKSYKKARDEFKRAYRISIDINKDAFDHMFATILYDYTEAIHDDVGKPHPDKNAFLRETRRAFGGYGEYGEIVRYPISDVTTYAARYFRHIAEFKQRVGVNEIYNLPINFFEYNENNPDIMYPPLNYIQVLIQTTAVLMQIDSADEEIRKIFNRNANKLVWMFESKEGKAKKYYQNLRMCQLIQILKDKKC